MSLTLNPGSGGAILGTDDVTGTSYQIVKMGVSVAGSAPVQVSTSNPLPITAPSAIPVTQSGAWSVSVTGTAAISAASLPLPTGAATSAKQPALGTAGTASTDVITVQGIAAMTALKVDGSGVTQPVSGTVTANQGGAPWSVNQTQWNGVAVDVNSGVKSAGTLRVVLATDQPSLSNALPVSQSGAWSVGTTPNSVAPVDHADVTVTATTTDSTIVANGSRKSVTICNLAANGGPIRVRLHASGVGGVEVLPGSFYNIQTQSALDVVNPNAASITYAWQEYQ